VTLDSHSLVAREQAAPRRSSAFGRTVQPGGLGAAGCPANPADISPRGVSEGGSERPGELQRHRGRSRSIPEEGDSGACQILPCFFSFLARDRAMLGTAAAAACPGAAARGSARGPAPTPPVPGLPAAHDHGRASLLQPGISRAAVPTAARAAAAKDSPSPRPMLQPSPPTAAHRTRAQHGGKHPRSQELFTGG